MSIRPILRGRDIKRYSYEFADLYLIATFPSLKINIDKYPGVKQHLMNFGYDRLKQTGEPGARKKTNNKWFETQDSIGYWEDFSRPKIVWGNLNLKASYCIADSGVFINAPSTMIVPADKCLLAILNSSLADYYIRKLGVTRNGGYFEYKPMFIEKLPIPHLISVHKDLLNSLVDSLLQRRKENLNTSEIERTIDEVVFDIYKIGLDEQEFVLRNKSACKSA